MARISSIDKSSKDSKKAEKGLVVTEDDESSEASSTTYGDNYTEYTASEDEEDDIDDDDDDDDDDETIDDDEDDDDTIDDDSIDDESVDDGTSIGESVDDSISDETPSEEEAGDQTLGETSVPDTSLKTADSADPAGNDSDNESVSSTSTTHGGNVGLSSAAIRERQNRNKGHDHEKMPIELEEAKVIIAAAMPENSLPPSVGAKSMIDPQTTIANPFAEDAQERLAKMMEEQAAANKARNAAIIALAESQRAASAKADLMNDSEYDQILQRMVAQNRRLNQDPKAMRRSARGIGKLRASFERLQTSRANNVAEAEGLGGASAEFGVGVAKNADELGADNAESIDWEFWGNLIKDYSNVLATSPIELSKAIYAGIPSVIRGMMWQLLSSSKDEELEVQYAKYLSLPCPNDRAIKRDLSRTFPDQKHFKDPKGRGQESLYNVVKAYSLFDPECGYCQGMQFVVGPLLLNMPDEEAFSTFVRLMHNYDLRGHFVPNMPSLQLRLYQFERLVEESLPLLHMHLVRRGIKSSMYASQWFMTLFSYRFPLDIVYRVLDAVFAEGIEAIFRFALALLQKNEEKLISLEFEDCLNFLKLHLVDAYTDTDDQGVAHVRTGELVHDAFQVKMPPFMLDAFASEFYEQVRATNERQIEMDALRMVNRNLRVKVQALEDQLNQLNAEHVDLVKRVVTSKLSQEEMAEELVRYKVITNTVISTTQTVRPHFIESSTMPVESKQPQNLIHSGWVLKKKKKKMQGYAKRWLMLSKDGQLSYSLSPDKEPRSSIEVPHASVSSDQQHRTIHVDSGSNVFHFKMLSAQDFEEWRGYMRRFLHVYSAAGDAPRSTQAELVEVLATLDRSDQLLQESMDQVEDSQTANSAKVISALLQVQNDNRIIRQTVVRIARGRSSSDDADEQRGSSGYSGAGATVAGVVGAGASAVASWALGRSHESDNISVQDDSSFHDAIDSNGVEYQINEEGVKGGQDDVSVEDDVDDDDDYESDEAANEKPVSKGVVYRSTLPSTVAGEDVSLFSVLKKNVGKDLSAISFPVTFNCPLSLLQASAEEYEYAPDLLERANTAKDWVDRLIYVGAFAISGYASTAGRTSRKPFNPLLGETYECVRADRRLRFVAEKVVHRPPIMATYADGEGWKAYGWSTVKNKFWGKSLELIPEGEQVVELSNGDKFSISRPSSFMRNLIAGNKYLEHVGELTVTNVATNQKIVVQFKESSMFGGPSSRNNIEGYVQDDSGSNKATIKGKWDDKVMRELSKNQLNVLWEAAQMPPRAEQYYGFTYFAMSLNEITDDIKDIIPPTDSRLRPDQRALENGDIDTAEEVKHTLEEAQRARRKELEASGTAYAPQWFHEGSGSEIKWMYGGAGGEDYFTSRDKAKSSGGWEVKNKDIFSTSGN
ncbi:Oxysterol-binding protein 3 [Malassezia cuniculi]|uniref:Oxysterol-binding protein 3 n=1 Tax=Malassezia cuniculi TaxID=948313 RepID=A0AAF0EV71_9BASI|nr:Oxysterol-binding protein 3 [Malassezia cuniculi]